MAHRKILWVVNYNTLADFTAMAQRAGATAVAIRSDNNLPKAIKAFDSRGIAVYAWRWPSSQEDAAMNEANKIANLLRNDNLAGYFVDPEGAPGKPYDWDRNGLEPLATEFSQTIKNAAPDKRYGVTSHYRAAKVFPKLPWKEFFALADVLLPQSYWRVGGGIVGHGIPADNYVRGIEAWKAAGGTKKFIAPMAGEIALTKPAELREYGQAAADAQIDELHFYTAESSVSDAVWTAIAQL